jgi:hypothetical protein
MREFRFPLRSTQPCACIQGSAPLALRGPSQLDAAALARLHFVDPVLETEADRFDRIGIGAQLKLLPFQDDIQLPSMIAQAQLDAADVVR